MSANPGWHVACGCQKHGDHLACTENPCQTHLGCVHPTGVEVTAPTEGEADERHGRPLTDDQRRTVVGQTARDRAADLYRWGTADVGTIIALRSAYVAGANSEREVAR